MIYHCSGCHGNRKKKNLKNTIKSSPQKLLAWFLWYFISSISVILGTNDAERNFDFIIFLVAMVTERKKLRKKYLKIFSKTADQILMKLHQKQQCDMGNKRYRTECWFHPYFGCYGNRKKKTEKKYLKIFFSKTTNQILMKHHQKHQCNMQMILSRILISLLFWLPWQWKGKSLKVFISKTNGQNSILFCEMSH